MKKEGIQNISIDDFHALEGKCEYLDEDFVIVDSLEASPDTSSAYRIDCVFLVTCYTGSMSFEMNSKQYRLGPDDFLIILPNSIMSGIVVSPDICSKLVGISTAFLQHMINMEKKMWNLIAYYYKNPVIHATEKDYSLFVYYRELIVARINGEKHRYFKQVMHYILSALFCELVAELGKYVPKEEREARDMSKFTRGELIFHQFIDRVMADNGMHRSVAYYADLLCYSPKYLSKVVKDFSGRTPLDIINDHAIEHIKRELKFSNKSVKEIAEQFNFSNHSFFGKYVKAALGVSPQQYRNLIKEETLMK